MITEPLDVSQLDPELRHPAIFNHFDHLKPGEGFVIFNDHDPDSLYQQLLDNKGNTFTWEYLEEGPRWWRIRITRLNMDTYRETVGSIAAGDYRKADVFKKMGIDFCCSGSKTISEASREAGIPEQDLLRALEQAETVQAVPAHDYRHWEPDFLADYIINIHHRYIYENSGIIDELARKVADRHGDVHPELQEVALNTRRFLKDLGDHLMREETVLFPNIRQLAEKKRDSSALLDLAEGSLTAKVKMLHVEHEVAGEDLKLFRELTHNYNLPKDACSSYNYLFEKLKEFENDLIQHIHLENNILFPKALELERKLTEIPG